MDYRKRGGRSPRRDYTTRNDDSYSPIRRYRSRTRSRSPRQRLPSIEKEKRLPLTSPRNKRSRSRSPHRDRYARREMNGSRRSRSPHERKSRADIEKPEYWGPSDPKVLTRAVLSPHRLVVVRKTGYDDENSSQKPESSERSRSHHDGMAKTDGENGLERHVYFRKTETTEAPIRTNYSRRNRPSPGRSRSTHGRDHSRDKRHYDKDDEKKNRVSRDKRQREHRYQNGNSKKSEEQNEDKKQNTEEETAVNEESDQTGMNEIPTTGMPIRPFHYGPAVPIGPYSMAYRPPPPPPPPLPYLMPRYHHPFIARAPFLPRFPPRPFPPSRFCHFAPAMY